MNGRLTTFGEVMKKVEVMSASCFDDLVPVKDIGFERLATVKIGSEIHHLKPLAQRQIAYRLGVPFPYLNKCPSYVQAYNLNHWIRNEPNDKLFFRFDADKVRAIFTPRYVPVDNFEILTRLEELGYSDEIEVQCHLDEEFLLLNIPDTDGEFVLKGLDRMKTGLSIANSEVGLSALSISAFLLRLVCTNGMIGTKDVTASYRHVSTRVLDAFPDVLADVSKDLGDQKDRLRFSLESSVDDPETTIKSFNRRFQLGKPEQEAVDWAWPQETGPTMFNVVNTYTRAAQHPKLTAEASYRLQRLGGRILAMLN